MAAAEVAGFLPPGLKARQDVAMLGQAVQHIQVMEGMELRILEEVEADRASPAVARAAAERVEKSL